jgi:hypothetical protein
MNKFANAACVTQGCDPDMFFDRSNSALAIEVCKICDCVEECNELKEHLDQTVTVG